MNSLHQLRKEKKIRMVDIASRIGISQSHYSNLERGKRTMSDNLLEKVAEVLGESKGNVLSAVNSNVVESYKLRSWLTNVRINGLPFIKAFRYHLEKGASDPNAMDDATLKKELRTFIESHIGYSVLAELSEKKNLIEIIRSKLHDAEVVPKESKTVNEQFEGPK